MEAQSTGNDLRQLAQFRIQPASQFIRDIQSHLHKTSIGSAWSFRKRNEAFAQERKAQTYVRVGAIPI